MIAVVNSQARGCVQQIRSETASLNSFTFRPRQYTRTTLSGSQRSFRKGSGRYIEAVRSSSNGSGPVPAERPDPDTNGAVGNSNARKRRSRGDDALPLSLYNPYRNLPTEGRTQSEGDEFCDPMERSCQTPMHVWESNCTMCYGTGTVTSYSGRRRSNRRYSSTCPGCHGLGAVRKTSSRMMPDVNGGNGQYTAGRPPAKIDDSKGKSLLERMQEKLNIQ